MPTEPTRQFIQPKNKTTFFLVRIESIVYLVKQENVCKKHYYLDMYWKPRPTKHLFCDSSVILMGLLNFRLFF